ncbi:NAD(P)/FAD-dependent oxidoreductase [Niveispirillum fermenti]|uniref:NAD(P)/FAD-dependent oxidoreductase n=1 Tax=Niveispirillum fermenti TaxID=1233113 RepID=UPI003A8705D7
MNADIIVIGAGLVGSAIAYGLANHGLKPLVLDGGDRDIRASSANFGLVWSHGKGMDMPAYQQLTRDSVGLWSDFSGELGALTAIDLQYERKGGLALCLGEAAYEQRRTELLRLHNQYAGPADWEMLDRRALTALMPDAGLGPDVIGASFGRLDGQANPLRLLTALHAGILRKGGRLLGRSAVQTIGTDRSGCFQVAFTGGTASAARIVIAAGLASKALAAQVGMDIPIRPQRGQILVTERLAPFLPLPTIGLRQTRDGTVMIGATHEEAGLDTAATSTAAAALSAEAVRTVPALGNVRLVRQWAGLRILTPDSYPIYAESGTHPGAFVALCHSGVTLAAVHAVQVAAAIAAGRLSSSFDVFHQRRFDVQEVA